MVITLYVGKSITVVEARTKGRNIPGADAGPEKVLANPCRADS